MVESEAHFLTNQSFVGHYRQFILSLPGILIYDCISGKEHHYEFCK